MSFSWILSLSGYILWKGKHEGDIYMDDKGEGNDILILKMYFAHS